jgi:hypothetical protein
VNDVAKSLANPHFAAFTEVDHGESITTLCESGVDYDLIVID